MHGRARPPGACTTASPATLVLPALSSLSCSRDSHTRRAAFLVVEHYWGQKLVATGSLEQALISSMGDLLISRGQHRQKRGAMQVLPRADLVALETSTDGISRTASTLSGSALTPSYPMQYPT